MKIPDPKSIVHCFVSTLAADMDSHNTLAIALFDSGVLNFKSAEKQVAGTQWMDSIPEKAQFNFIVADLPIGMGKEKMRIGNSEINVRKNWCELTKALRLLTEMGLCLAIVEPPAFGLGEGPQFLEKLDSEGFHLNGVFNTPENLLETTQIRPVLIVISRNKREHIFAAELEGEEQVVKLAQAFMSGTPGKSLNEGILIGPRTFTGFAKIKAEQQISRLETQYKQYESIRLSDIAVEINTVRSGENHGKKENAIYIPIMGTSYVTHDLEKVSIKHHNLFQVVLSEKADNEYLSAFFQSELGRTVLKSLPSGAAIPKIRKTDLAEAKVALPKLKEQEEIAFTFRRLSDLSSAISEFQNELALNPKSASAIKIQLENMLEQIGKLSDAEKVLRLTRSGESKTVEYKEAFSLDVQKGKKEKYIELSALKTIVAFLNTNGGTLLIGVSDSGEITGIGEEVRKFHKSNDRFLLNFKNQIKDRIGQQYYPFINQRLVTVLGAEVLMVECGASNNPCYLDGREFFVRTNPATDKLEGPKLVEYVQNHFKG
ncbi:MAG: putative DNA binding domain-containing protein [Deltaproteobacteria bacterium]|nr:putative DNA binding domain-containing protein [Deltaproteobacteria bacterium]